MLGKRDRGRTDLPSIKELLEALQYSHLQIKQAALRVVRTDRILLDVK